ncbi:MAG: molybdopterin molybdotransferase MoeA, partial [Bacteroidota bacterium]
MKSVGEAREIILQSVPAALEEKLPLLQAHRRVLAETVIAEADIPAFDNSSMDGFALSSEDTQRANQSIPVTLQLAGEVAAGSVLSQAIPAGSAVRIMTGAPIPRGANAVIEQEAVVARNGIVQVGIPVAEGRNIRKKGEDIRSGATILELGTLMKAAHLGVLASLGVSHVSVYRKPTVAFLATGNELVDLSQEPEEGQIRNSNAYTLWGLVEESGGVPVNLGTAKDDEHELMEKLRRGLSYDMLMTSGGVSVGAYDYVLKALEDLGVQRKFWKVNIK